MSISNCMIFAARRSIRRGGVLLFPLSHCGPYPHAMWAERLPEGMAVEHFVPDDKSQRLHLEPLFRGYVEYSVGPLHANPPVQRGPISWVFLVFWLSWIVGWCASLAWLAFWIWR